MKRILVRLSALVAVVAVGVLAVALAQRSVRSGTDAEQATGESQEKPPATQLAETDRLAPPPDPTDRYASDVPAHDSAPPSDPFAKWHSGANSRATAASDAIDQYEAPRDGRARDETASKASQDLADAAAAAIEGHSGAPDVPPQGRTADDPAGRAGRYDTAVEPAAYDTQTEASKGGSSAAAGRAPRAIKAAAGEPTLAPPQGGVADRYARESAAANGSANSDIPDARQLPGGEPDLFARPGGRGVAREPEPLDLPPDTTARQLDGTGIRGADGFVGQDNFARPAAAPADEQSEGTGRPGGKQLEGPQTPTLSIEKTAPQEIQVGKPAVFQVVVRNTGQTPALGVEVHDQIPRGTRLVSTTPRATQTPQGELVWSLGTVKAGEEASLQMELMPLAEGEIGSVATVHFAAESSVRTHATKPQLTLEVKAQPEVMINDEITLSIKLSNTGSGAATGVVLQEAVPEALEHAAGPELEYEVGELKPGETKPLELTMKAVKAGRLTNALYARGEGSAQAECKTEIEVIAPALELKIDGPKRRYLDRQAVYTLSIANPGTAAATQVQLQTHLPPGLKFVEANNAGQYDAQTRSVHWLLDELPANEMGNVTLTVLPVEAGEQPLAVECAADRGLSAKREQMIVVEGVSAILFTVADVADPVEINGETTYEIRVVNQGTKAATNLQLVALLPDELKPTGAEGPSKYVIDGQRVLFDPLPQLAPKADTTFKVKAQAVGAGDVRMRVELVTDEMRTPVKKEESTRVYADE